ncbi:hypothetical protein N7539_000491 [Penicillium diatomitis]|uniref:Uncharacterized protein n=1 Tax=Penicillium diatomitis TaxID=2819901 RepID=A0A9W9XMN8_9EURO|nr:uncharacterized protein N7539_000491 [Penicillium diatomitis]KAJ5495375.1 hypothetical protein N7539_000491 [Penicillium diatomitis]
MARRRGGWMEMEIEGTELRDSLGETWCFRWRRRQGDSQQEDRERRFPVLVTGGHEAALGADSAVCAWAYAEYRAL